MECGLIRWTGAHPHVEGATGVFRIPPHTVFSVSVVVQARRVVEALTCEDVALKSDVAIPSDGAALDGFVDRYGDSWVKAVVLGGQMQGIYTLYAQSREQAKGVATAVDLLS